MAQLLLRLLLVFGGIAVLLVLVQKLIWTNAILFVVLLGGGLPFLLLLVIFAALYQRPRDR